MNKKIERSIYKLAFCIALVIAGYMAVLPILAKFVTNQGNGIEVLSLMISSFYIAQIFGAMVMGRLADIYGKKNLLIVSIVFFIISNICLALAKNTESITAIRAIEGFFTASILPITITIVSNMVSKEEKGKWIGVVTGGYFFGFTVGPFIGGMLFDIFGLAITFFMVSIMAALSLIMLLKILPNDLEKNIKISKNIKNNKLDFFKQLQDTLPDNMSSFVLLLIIDFALTFAFALSEPQMLIHFYETLNWSATQYGIMIACYGLALSIMQIRSGSLSDKYNKKYIISIGCVLSIPFFIFPLLFSKPIVIFAGAFLAGIAVALIMPALNTTYVELSKSCNLAFTFGIKQSFNSLARALAPISILVFYNFSNNSIKIFLISSVILIVSSIVVLTTNALFQQKAYPH